MADITKIIRGMQNGAETIDNNFNKINQELGILEKFVDVIYPVGAFFISSVSTDPKDLFKTGTWARVKGRVLVGVDESDTALSTSGKQGGSINPLSQHTIIPTSGNFVLARGAGTNHWASASAPSGSYAMDTEPSVIKVGGNTNHNNWQPFETAYIWKSTA